MSAASVAVRQGTITGLYAAALRLSSPFVPGIAALVTVSVCLARLPSATALIAGAVAALSLWLLSPLVIWRKARVDTSNPVMYDQLRERLVGLEQRLATPPSEHYDHAVYRQAREYCVSIREALEDRAPGLQWVTATGYNNLWNLVHRIEEALILLSPADAVIGQALYDEGRLTGAPLGNQKHLTEQLRSARKELEDTLRSSTKTVEPVARANLHAIAYLINRFRGERWEALARAHIQLDDTAELTGLVAYTILVVVLLGEMATVPMLTAAALFFLIGAVVGLFNRLLGDIDSDHVIEDYGLSQARLLHTPLFSGLAAIGGVMIVAMLPEANGAPLNLDAAFDLAKNPFGLLVAAVFGLTPRLLIDRLQSKTEQYKSDLKKSAASDGEHSG